MSDGRHPRLTALIRGGGILSLALLGVGATAAPALAQNVKVKLGTVAPDGSAWHLLLQDMGAEWSELSGGKVKLQIFPGGIQGNEGDVIRKMRIGQLQAGALSVIGIRDIDTGPQTLTTPGLIGDEEELAYVYERVAPVWEKRLAEKGFIALSWGDTGWAHLFSKREVRTPEDARGLKVFAWSGDPGAVDASRQVGFQPVVLSVTDMLPGLSTGMIEGFVTANLLAMTARWYEHAPHMLDFRWGRLAGATLITRDAWDRIPQDLRPKLMASARKIGERVNAEVTRMGGDAVEAMQRNGLKVVELTAAERARWQEASERTWPVIREKVVPPEDFDLVKRVRDEYRAARRAGTKG